MSKRGPKPTPIADRFYNMVKRGDGCWEWLGAKNGPDRYGVIGVKHPRNRNLLAHRVSYELSYGPVPDDVWVLHRCDNPGCVRPDHLFLGTRADNFRDMALKERSGGQKLSREDAFAILWREASGETRQDLADEYKLTYQCVRALVRRETWPSLSQSHD